jgi:hypothetical protein
MLHFFSQSYCLTGGVAKMKKLQDDTNYETLVSETISELVIKIQKSAELFNSSVVSELLQELVDNYIKYQEKLQIITCDTENFATLGQIEQLLLEMKAHQNDINLKIILNSITNIKCEDELIAQKKKSTENKE